MKVVVPSVLVLSLMIAASRVVLTSHWLGDTFAGYLLGAVIAVLLHHRFKKRGWLDEPAGLLRAKATESGA